MIQENEIFYDKRNHKTYVAEITGKEFTLLKPIEIGAIEGNMGGCVYAFGGEANLENYKIVPNDLMKLAPPDGRGRQHFHNIPVFRIGKMHHGVGTPCNNIYLDPNCYCRIKCMREKDGFKPKESGQMTTATEPKISDKIAKAVPTKTRAKRKKKTTKKKVSPELKNGGTTGMGFGPTGPTRKRINKRKK